MRGGVVEGSRQASQQASKQARKQGTDEGRDEGSKERARERERESRGADRGDALGVGGLGADVLLRAADAIADLELAALTAGTRARVISDCHSGDGGVDQYLGSIFSTPPQWGDNWVST
jgi:hypothetical protein